MKSMKVLGQSVNIPDSRISYNQYRLMFQEEADQAVHRFEQLYRQNQNLDDVIKHAPQQISDSVRPAVQLCVNTLVKHGILTIDAARFEEQYPDYQAPWTDAYFKLSDQYAEIVMDQESLDAYRVARRKGRARWSGGGFGVSGALKGAATAGAFNMVAGAGHMLFNGMGKLISSAAASSQKNKIYRSPETLSSLSQGVWDSVFYLHGALIDCLSKTGADPLPLQGSVSPVQSREAIAILNNASSIGDSEQCRAALIEAFEKDPYQENWYISAFERFGDDGTLDALARYFGISGLQAEKIRRLDAFAATLPLATEGEAQEAIAQIEQYQQKIRCAEKPEHVQAVYRAAAEFDRQYRTVDGITLPTRDAADLARTEYTAISSIESKIDYYRLGLSFSEALCAVLSSGLSKLCEEINASKNNLEKMILGSLSDLKAKTLSNIDRGLRNKLLPLAADPHVSHAFRGSREGAPCFSWNDLEYSNIFLRIPPDKVKAWGSAINLMYTQLIRYLEQRPEKHSVQGAKNVQTLLVMDEFPQFGKLDLIVSAIPTLRSKSVNLCLVAQSIAQLDMLYGEYGRRIIFDNSQFQLILRANDADTQDLLCRLTGSTTVLQESVQKSLDPSGGSIGYSKQRTQIREPRIFPHQFSTLTDLLLLSPYGTCLLKKHQPHSEPVRISQNFDSGITVSSTNISNEGFLRMLTIKERTQAATKRAEAAQHTQRVHERNERNRTNKECARRNFIIGELVVSTFPELSKIIPGTAEENAARFRPLKKFLTQLAASPDLIDAIRKRAALPCSSGEITNPVQMGHDV